MKKVKVLDIKHPTLCYKQEVKDGVITTFIRCNLSKKHKGKHSWERKHEKARRS